MKKNLLLTFSLFSLIGSSLYSAPNLSWHEARKAIIKKAEMVTKTYNAQDCPWLTRLYDLVLSPEFETEAWQIAEKIIGEVIPKLAVFKKAMENPHDEIYMQELILQASMIAGQIAAQVHDNFEFGGKVGAIVGGYIEVLKENIRTK